MPGKLTHGKECTGLYDSSVYKFDEIVTQDWMYAVLHRS
jgi:hypothetical protein